MRRPRLTESDKYEIRQCYALRDHGAVKALAERLGRSPGSIYTFALRNALSGIKVGQRKRFAVPGAIIDDCPQSYRQRVARLTGTRC